MVRHPLCNKGDVPEGRSRSFNVAGRKVLVLNRGGAFSAFRNFCPHMGGTVRYNGSALRCEWHGALFDAATGEPRTAPAVGSGPIERVRLVEDGEELYCEIEERERSPWADDF